MAADDATSALWTTFHGAEVFFGDRPVPTIGIMGPALIMGPAWIVGPVGLSVSAPESRERYRPEITRCQTGPVSGFDARIWRVLNRVLLVLAVGVLGILLGLGPHPGRGDSVFGLIIVLIVTLPVIVPFWRQSPRERRAWKQWPRRRPLVTATAAVLACVTLLVLWWTIANALSPGTLSPLSLALVAVALAGVLALVGNLLRRV